MSNVAGFPRPVLKREGHNTPVPWVGADGPTNGEWAHVDTARATRADDEHLCIICGQPRGDDYVYGLLFGHAYEHRGDPVDVMLGTAGPAPTFGHPRCILLAATYCPHLKRQVYPAQDQDGRKLTYDELRELAHAKRA